MKKSIITAFKNPNSEGVTLELNIPTKLKNGSMKTKERFVSWDKIGGLLFDNYATGLSVDEMTKLRTD